MNKLLYIPLALTLGAVVGGLTYYVVVMKGEEEPCWHKEKERGKRKKK